MWYLPKEVHTAQGLGPPLSAGHPFSFQNNFQNILSEGYIAKPQEQGACLSEEKKKRKEKKLFYYSYS